MYVNFFFFKKLRNRVLKIFVQEHPASLSLFKTTVKDESGQCESLENASHRDMDEYILILSLHIY